MGLTYWIIIVGFALFALLGIRIVRPTERGLIERLGDYKKFAKPGFNWIIPGIDKMIKKNITEQMVDAQPQEIITKDNLNAKVDAQIYFKIKSSEEDVKKAEYNVFNITKQIVNLARTTLRDVIGNLTLVEANSQRGKLNDMLAETMAKETKNWGIEIVRTELKEIEPPSDVQDTMNKIVKAENEKIAAKDFATARETEADGIKRASIKEAEGAKQSAILRAEGEKEAIIAVAEGKEKEIKLVNEALQKHFKKNAVVHEKLQTVKKAFVNSTKYVIDRQTGITNVISDVAGITPINTNEDKPNKRK